MGVLVEIDDLLCTVVRHYLPAVTHAALIDREAFQLLDGYGAMPWNDIRKGHVGIGG